MCHVPCAHHPQAQAQAGLSKGSGRGRVVLHVTAFRSRSDLGFSTVQSERWPQKSREKGVKVKVRLGSG
eukprot:scaffold11970_cov112-Isochrysis_galbana.AAC.5